MADYRVWYSIDQEEPPENRSVAATSWVAHENPEYAAEDALDHHFWTMAATPEYSVVFLYTGQEGDLIGSFAASPEIKVHWHIFREDLNG